MAADNEEGTDIGSRLVAAGGQRPDIDLASVLDGHYAAWLNANAAWTEFIRDEEAIGTVPYDEITATLRQAREVASRTPPRTTTYVAALLHIWWDEYGPYLSEADLHLPDDVHDLAPLFIARMWRATTGLEGWPR